MAWNRSAGHPEPGPGPLPGTQAASHHSAPTAPSPAAGELTLLRPEIGEQHPPTTTALPLIHSLCGFLLGLVPNLGWARRGREN